MNSQATVYAEKSEPIRERVIAARNIQPERFGDTSRAACQRLNESRKWCATFAKLITPGKCC